MICLAATGVRKLLQVCFLSVGLLQFPSIVTPFIMSERKATISRKTNETSIEVSINLDTQPGSGLQQVIDVSTGIGFLDHVRSHFHKVDLLRP